MKNIYVLIILENSPIVEELYRQQLRVFSDSYVLLSLSLAGYRVQQAEGSMLAIWCLLMLGKQSPMGGEVSVGSGFSNCSPQPNIQKILILFCQHVNVRIRSGNLRETFQQLTSKYLNNICELSGFLLSRYQNNVSHNCCVTDNIHNRSFYSILQVLVSVSKYLRCMFFDRRIPYSILKTYREVLTFISNISVICWFALGKFELIQN